MIRYKYAFDSHHQTPAEKLRIAFDLHRAGVRLMRQNLRRRHPHDSETEIDERLRAWLQTRSGADYGDTEGRGGFWTPDSTLEGALAQARTDLDELGYSWCLVGGLAMAVRAEPRFTRDVDIAVVVEDDRNAEALAMSLQARGYQPVTIIEYKAAGRMATIRLLPPIGGGVVLDLLFASSGIELEIVASSEPIEMFPDLSVPVASAPHLLALKILARDDTTRPQDSIDIRALLQVTTDEDLATTRQALELIRGRGFHRDRDLLAAFDNLVPCARISLRLPVPFALWRRFSSSEYVEYSSSSCLARKRKSRECQSGLSAQGTSQQLTDKRTRIVRPSRI
ncbi:MAG: nucleotidyl transferase AbiEii/AbiGii toxin family protein [Acidobacteriota bacterium]